MKIHCFEQGVVRFLPCYYPLKIYLLFVKKRKKLEQHIHYSSKLCLYAGAANTIIITLKSPLLVLSKDVENPCIATLGTK